MAYNDYDDDVSCFILESKLTNIKEYEKWNVKGRRKSATLTPIVGDLKEYGWAVYKGVNTWDVKNAGTLLEDCRDIINRSIPNMKWIDAQKCKIGGTGRFNYKITRAKLDKKEQEPKVLQNLIKLYLGKILDKIKTIKSFEDGANRSQGSRGTSSR